MALEPYVQPIYCDGTFQTVQPLWQPVAITVINECDAVVQVTDGRQLWRVAPGGYLSRPCVAPGPGGFRAKSERLATQGSALVIFHQEALALYGGVDASGANLFRRRVIDIPLFSTTSPVPAQPVVSTTVQFGSARFAQLMISGFMNGPLASTYIGLQAEQAVLLNQNYPYSGGNIALCWRFGPGGDWPLPASLLVKIETSPGAVSPGNALVVYMDVWEG